jgi:hypothetical protein
MTMDIIGEVSFKDMDDRVFYWNKMLFYRITESKAFRLKIEESTKNKTFPNYEPFETWTFAPEFKLNISLSTHIEYYYDEKEQLVKYWGI